MRQCNRWNLLIGNLSSGVGWGGGGSSNEEVVFRRLGGLLLSLPHGVKSSAIEEDQEGERRLSAGCNLSCRIRFKIIDPRGWRREMASRYFRTRWWRLVPIGHEENKNSAGEWTGFDEKFCRRFGKGGKKGGRLWNLGMVLGKNFQMEEEKFVGSFVGFLFF